MKKILITILTLFLFTSLANASVSFSPAPQYDGIIYSNSVVVKVTTSSPVLCRYSENSNTLFEDASPFDDEFETVHKIILTNKPDNVYRYYVKCRPYDSLDDPLTETKDNITFKLSNPIAAANIELTDTILKEGKYEISLTTTKIPRTTPKLQFSYDGITYSPIPLHGDGTSWKGFLTIPSNAGEKVGLFKFEATDLEGRSGAHIFGNNIFEVDTIAPPQITSIDASGEYGQIKLKWFLDENKDATKINIYRSESPNVGLIDFYKTIPNEKGYYYDTDTESGKTYYYRLSSEDDAGNKADLSREIQATSLLSETTSTTALSPLLVGSVDSLISEIELIEVDIENADEMIRKLDSSEQEYLKLLKVTGNFQSAKSELALLKRNVEGYKLTDMTKEILDNKLDSSRIKLNIIKKKIPDTFSKIDSLETKSNPTEETTRKAILEYLPELSPSEITKTIKNSLKIAEENNLDISSKINIFETTYIDGTTSTQSIIEHSLDGTLSKTEGSKFILKLPTGALDLSSLSIKNLDYTKEQDDLISFETDTKKITYILDQKIDPQILKEISVSLIAVQPKTDSLTGYFLSEIPYSSSKTGSAMAMFLILAASGLIGYLLYIKQKQKTELSLNFLSRAQKVKELQKNGKTEEAETLYNELKIEYLGLSKEQKSKVFREIKHLTKQ